MDVNLQQIERLDGEGMMPWVAKELSWLSFNERVLQEAADPTVPVIQRIRYLGIFSNNLDEFFRVRVADVRRLAAFSVPSRQEEYRQLLASIQRRVITLQKRFDGIYLDALHKLRERHIYLINESQLDEGQQQFCRRYFRGVIQRELVPYILDEGTPFPELNDASIYLAVKLNLAGARRFSLIEIPTSRLQRFVRIPGRKGHRGKVLIVLENIIRLCLNEVFHGIFDLDDADAYTVKLTRDGELELGEEVTESFFQKVSSSLKRRRKADPVRFVYDATMPAELLDYLTRRLGLGKLDSMIPGGRYHNSKDFMKFPNLGASYLDLKPHTPIEVPEIESAGNIFECMRKRDLLLYYPYHSFEYLVEFVKTAAIDPAVRSIRICLYRVASDSHIVDALFNAVANQKAVTVVLELQARFDEEANVSLASRLTEGGVDVILGVPGLKVHCKLMQVLRQEGSIQRYYTHVGTGNFNEKSAAVYTDFSLLTYDQEIGEEVSRVFDFIEFNYKRHDFQHLIVSPVNTRRKITGRIATEIDHARRGKRCGITMKLNNLVDQGLIQSLYEASQAGVPVRLIVRGMCSLVPGIAGVSDNIQVISIVDRFLEHARVMIFQNGGDTEVLFGSADMMTRNIDFRVEVLVPVNDRRAKQMVQTILDIQWRDNVKARVIDAGQGNQLRTRKRRTPVMRSQELIYEYLSSGQRPRIKKLKYRPIKAGVTK